MNVSGKTRLYCVIGDPIEHSLSPVMQNAAFEAKKLDCVFVAFKVAPLDVELALRGMRGLGICGMNVTMPNKNAVVEYLDEVDETAKLLGSVNTILNQERKLKGFSTDGIGALNALRKNGVPLSGKKLVLLGAGGAARAIAFALVKEVDEVTILNRTTEKTAALSKEIARLYKKKIAIVPLTKKSVKESLQNADILINATSVGMKQNSVDTLVENESMRPELTVMDIIYNPLETKLAKEAKAIGAKVINGIEMLIYQGAASFEIWTGLEAPVEVMRKTVLNKLDGAQC